MAALLLGVIRSPFAALDATTYVRVAYRHLTDKPVEFSGPVLRHVDKPVSACRILCNPLAADRPRGNRQNAHEGTGRSDVHDVPIR